MASPGEDYHTNKRRVRRMKCASDHERLNKRMVALGQSGEFNDLMNDIRDDADNWTLTVKQHGYLRQLFQAYFGEGSSIT